MSNGGRQSSPGAASASASANPSQLESSLPATVTPDNPTACLLLVSSLHETQPPAVGQGLENTVSSSSARGAV